MVFQFGALLSYSLLLARFEVWALSSCMAEDMKHAGSTLRAPALDCRVILPW